MIVDIPGKKPTANCKFCDYPFRSQTSFTNHLRKAHGDLNIRPYKCNLCEYRGARSASESSCVRMFVAVHVIYVPYVLNIGAFQVSLFLQPLWKAILSNTRGSMLKIDPLRAQFAERALSKSTRFVMQASLSAVCVPYLLEAHLHGRGARILNALCRACSSICISSSTRTNANFRAISVTALSMINKIWTDIKRTFISQRVRRSAPCAAVKSVSSSSSSRVAAVVLRILYCCCCCSWTLLPN